MFLADKKAQIAPFMVMVIAVVILAIAATILINEAAFTRLRLANVTDGAVITASSKLCQRLNQIRAIDTMMKYNCIQLQASLVRSFFKPYPSFVVGYAFAYGSGGNSILGNKKLFDEANGIARSAGQELRTAMYGGILQGALIDEPKPFRKDLKEIEEKDGFITSIDYDAYNKREDRFTEQFRLLKSQDSAWYDDNFLGYTWNKYYPASKNNPGIFTHNSNPVGGYDSSLQISLTGVDKKVGVKKMPMVFIFFYLKVPTPPLILPGIVLNPWAWIRGTTVDGDTMEINVTRQIPFKKMPFFSDRVETLRQQSRVKMKGSIRKLYRFELFKARS